MTDIRAFTYHAGDGAMYNYAYLIVYDYAAGSK